MQKIDITKCSEFMVGVARFSRIAADPKTGVEAWRRSYAQPWMDRVEIIVPEAGKYYPEDARIMRRIPANDPRLREKIDHYLPHGPAVPFPGDEKKSIFED